MKFITINSINDNVNLSGKSITSIGNNNSGKSQTTLLTSMNGNNPNVYNNNNNHRRNSLKTMKMNNDMNIFNIHSSAKTINPTPPPPSSSTSASSLSSNSLSSTESQIIINHHHHQHHHNQSAKHRLYNIRTLNFQLKKMKKLFQSSKSSSSSSTTTSSAAINIDPSSLSISPIAANYLFNNNHNNNLCYQSIINHNHNHNNNDNCSIYNLSDTTTTTATTAKSINHYPLHRLMDGKRYDCRSKSSITNPMVSFMNKGDGKIALNLADKRSSLKHQQDVSSSLVILQNDNQLYSMNLLNNQQQFSNHNHQIKSTNNCYLTLNSNQNNIYNYIDENDPLSFESWYYGQIERNDSIELIRNLPTGTFIVRRSTTIDDCYALTVRVPYDHNHTGIAHYLIQHQKSSQSDNSNDSNNVDHPPNGDDNSKQKDNQSKIYKIKGFQKEFPTIQSLIIHHSIMKEQLPCTLRLMPHRLTATSPSTPPMMATTKSSDECYDQCSEQAAAANQQQKLKPKAMPTNRRKLSSSSKLQNNGFNTNHSISLNRSNWNLRQQSSTISSSISSPQTSKSSLDLDRMVDVDLDPTYQRILENFRKVMAHCN